MTNRPLVNIITPCRNAKLFIQEYIHSLRAQTYPNWICIIVDDNSTDGSFELLKYLVGSDPRFLLTNHMRKPQSKGPSGARNLALKHVRASLVAFCDIDDLWHPLKLERQVQYHLSNNLDLSVTAYCRFTSLSNQTVPTSLILPASDIKSQLKYGKNPIPMLTSMVDSAKISHSFQSVPHEDYLFWLQLMSIHPHLKMGCLPEVLAYYRVHSSNLSNKKLYMPLWTFQVYRSFGYGLLKSSMSLLVWAIQHLLQLIHNPSRVNRPRCVHTMMASQPIQLHYHS